MSPRSPRCDSPGLELGNSEGIGQFSMRQTKCAKFTQPQDVSLTALIKMGCFALRRAPLIPHVRAVISCRPEKEVHRIDTAAHVTVMKHLKCGWNRSAEERPRDAMRVPDAPRALIAILKQAVSLATECACPETTFGGDGNFCHEAREGLRINTEKRNKLISSHREPPQKVPLVRLGVDVSASRRAAFHSTRRGAPCQYNS